MKATKDVVIHMTAEQAQTWLTMLSLIGAALDSGSEHYDRINRLTVQLTCALDNTEAFGVTQTACTAHVEVSK